MNPLAIETRAAFERLFQTPAEAHFLAPGRVNLIGEHTDYNDGFALPAAIDFHTCLAGKPRADRIVRLCALDQGESWSQFSLDEPIERDPKAPWSDYLRGVCHVMLSSGFQLSGADLLVHGNIPQGTGLSSSASLEVATARALTGFSGEALDGPAAARFGQRAENEFVGIQCGIMDQLVSACGLAGHATLIDCRSLDIKPVHLPEDAAIVVINSRIQRGLVDSEYNSRRQQCEQAARILGVPSLRDATTDDLIAHQRELPAVTARRARHILTDNDRTLAMVKALESSDWTAIGKLMAASHASMRYDFEITLPAIDELVDAVAAELNGIGGVRMTGGGFGGCMVAVVPQSQVETVLKVVERGYPDGRTPAPVAYVCQPVNGAYPQG
ncbi:galactokinase [Saccharospirillum mangrovi]|uniref:galactokinase n=1 Tax=Saccharospirillum mangrovi TaxID=2161747 RepID=UPI000D341AE2|nr:galactokinase [Saccharospirillum mangrovi]